MGSVRPGDTIVELTSDTSPDSILNRRRQLPEQVGVWRARFPPTRNYISNYRHHGVNQHAPVHTDFTGSSASRTGWRLFGAYLAHVTQKTQTMMGSVAYLQHTT
jgi:hypothetical protein